MKKHPFFIVPIIGIFLFIGCQENTPDAATAEIDTITAEIDVATAEKMVRDFNVKFQQDPEQVLAQNISDGFVFVNGEGGFVTKAQMAEIMKSWKIAKWELNNLNVQVFGNVFVATGVNNHTMVANEDGNTVDFQTAFTYVYQEQDGKLELLSQQHSHVQNATDE